jgi:hypothetical protein
MSKYAEYVKTMKGLGLEVMDVGLFRYKGHIIRQNPATFMFMVHEDLEEGYHVESGFTLSQAQAYVNMLMDPFYCPGESR